MQNRKMMLIIGIILVVGIFIVGFLLKVNTHKTLSGIEYKSITKIERPDIIYYTNTLGYLEGVTPLNKMSQLDMDLKEYFSQNHSQKEKDALYATYIKNLLYYSNMISFADWHENDHPNKIRTGYGYGKYDKWIYAPYGILSFDQLYLGDIVYAGEGMYNFVPNFGYQITNYWQYLSPVTHEFLTLELFQNYLGYTYYSDGYVRSLSQLRVWMCDLEYFIKRHPNFYLNNIVRQQINDYGSAFTNNASVWEDSRMTDAAKVEYELFLTTNDKSTPSYKAMKKLYRHLKSNDFKSDDKFWELHKTLWGQNVRTY